MIQVVFPSRSTLRHPIASQESSMPREAKSDPLFCCGELHKSANYHKRTVHQKYTKIYFKHHPDAGFLLRRNPKTCLFHCPQCDKSWAMATPVQNHIHQRCEGYVKYRSPIPTIEGKPTEGVLPIQVKNEDNATMEGSAADAAEEIVDRKEVDVVDFNPVVHAPVHPNPDLASRSNPRTTPVPPSPPSSTSNDSPSPDRPGSKVPAHPFPLLRPALWPPDSTTNGVGMNATTHNSRPSVPSLPPSLTGAFSPCSSMLSVRTWPDDQPPGVPVPTPRFKTESDVHMLDSVSTSGFASGSGSGSPFGPRPMGHVMDFDRPSSAARLFLDGLRRPLGHAARHLHALGIVSEADLDLICTMPDAWDELGELLTRSGVTVIEWLMVKEAFKARARQVSSGV